MAVTTTNIPPVIEVSSGQPLESPNLVAGDFQIALDEGAFANATNLLTVLESGWIRIQLTAAERNGDRFRVQLIDQDSIWSSVLMSDNPESASGLTGANVATIAVTDGTTPIQGAIVRMTKGGESGWLTTDENGQAKFSVNDGTWTVSIVARGFALFAPASLVVSGNTPQTFELNAFVISPSSDGKTTAYFVLLDENCTPRPDVEVTFNLIQQPNGSGNWYDDADLKVTSDSGGLVQASLVIGGKYQITSECSSTKVTIPTNAGDSLRYRTTLSKKFCRNFCATVFRFLTLPFASDFGKRKKNLIDAMPSIEPFADLHSWLAPNMSFGHEHFACDRFLESTQVHAAG